MLGTVGRREASVVPVERTVPAFVSPMLAGNQRRVVDETKELAVGAALLQEDGMRQHHASLEEAVRMRARLSIWIPMNGRKSKSGLIVTGIWEQKRAALRVTRNIILSLNTTILNSSGSWRSLISK